MSIITTYKERIQRLQNNMENMGIYDKKESLSKIDMFQNRIKTHEKQKEMLNKGLLNITNQKETKSNISMYTNTDDVF